MQQIVVKTTASASSTITIEVKALPLYGDGKAWVLVPADRLTQ